MNPVSRDDTPNLQMKTLRPREVRVTDEEEVEPAELGAALVAPPVRTTLRMQLAMGMGQ